MAAPAEIEVQYLTEKERNELMEELQQGIPASGPSSSQLLLIRYEATLRDSFEKMQAMCEMVYSTAIVTRTQLHNIMLATSRYVPEEKREKPDA